MHLAYLLLYKSDFLDYKILLNTTKVSIIMGDKPMFPIPLWQHCCK